MKVPNLVKLREFTVATISMVEDEGDHVFISLSVQTEYIFIFDFFL